MLMRVLAFDPGETTGVLSAAVRLDEQQLQFDINHVEQVDYDDRYRLHRLIGALVPHVVVVENFLLYKHKAKDQINSDFKTVRIIGLLDLSCYIHRGSSVGRPYHWVEQNASVMERVQVLPEHEDALKGRRHATSAYKHVRYFCTMNFEKLSSFYCEPRGSES